MNHCHQFRPTAATTLPENRVNVVLDRCDREVEPVRDFLVRQALHDQVRHQAAFGGQLVQKRISRLRPGNDERRAQLRLSRKINRNTHTAFRQFRQRRKCGKRQGVTTIQRLHCSRQLINVFLCQHEGTFRP